jgi:hypothetical protein
MEPKPMNNDGEERPRREPQPSDLAFGEFAGCAGLACMFELKVRVLADLVPEIQRYARKDMSVLAKEVLAHPGFTMDAEERALLNECARLRNKLLHAEFSSVAGRLTSFGAELGSGGVWKFSLRDEFEPMQVSKTSTENMHYGWLFESFGSGALHAGGDVFMSGIRLVERLTAKAASGSR